MYIGGEKVYSVQRKKESKSAEEDPRKDKERIGARACDPKMSKLLEECAPRVGKCPCTERGDCVWKCV